MRAFCDAPMGLRRSIRFTQGVALGLSQPLALMKQPESSSATAQPQVLLGYATRSVRAVAQALVGTTCGSGSESLVGGRGVKNFEITYRDGRVRFIAADEALTHAGRTVFSVGGRIVAVVPLAEVAFLNELGPVRPPRGARAERSALSPDRGDA